MPGALVSNTTERSAKGSVVSASLALAAYPDEDDELELLDDELFEDELLDDELLEDELLEDELLEDEPEVPPHPPSTTAKTASVKFRDFIFRSKRSLLELVNELENKSVPFSDASARIADGFYPLPKTYQRKKYPLFTNPYVTSAMDGCLPNGNARMFSGSARQSHQENQHEINKHT